MTEIPTEPTLEQKLAVAAAVIELLASYEDTSIWYDDRDGAAYAMLQAARSTRNYLKAPSECTATALSNEINE